MRGHLIGTWLAGLLAAVLTAGSAAAQEGAPDAAAAAQAAAEVVDLHCASVDAGKSTESAEALVAVTPVLARVSRAHDASGETYLLYWRGVLGACVGQEERGIADLEKFLAGVGDEPAYAAQVKEAGARLTRLTGAPPVKATSARAAPGIVAGAALLAAGGALGGLSAWQGQLLQDAQAEFEAGTKLWADTETVGQEGDAAAAASNGLLVASIGSGVAGAVVIGVAAATGNPRSTAAVLMPLPQGGLALNIGGRW